MGTRGARCGGLLCRAWQDPEGDDRAPEQDRGHGAGLPAHRRFGGGLLEQEEHDGRRRRKTTTTTAAPSSGSNDGSPGGSSGGALSAAQCASAGAAYGKVLAGALAAGTGNTAGLSELQSEYDALGASIPSNLKDDYDTVAKAYTQFEKDLKGVSVADPASLAKIQTAEKDLNNSDVTAAASKISSFFENHCQS